MIYNDLIKQKNGPLAVAIKQTVKGSRTMETHVIELITDITNPQPDRRSKDWTKLPVLKAGWRFIAKASTISVTDRTLEYWSIERADRGWPWTSDKQPLGKLILDNSKPVEPATWREMAAVTDVMAYSDSILEDLIKLGRVSLSDFRAIYEFEQLDGASQSTLVEDNAAQTADEREDERGDYR